MNQHWIEFTVTASILIFCTSIVGGLTFTKYSEKQFELAKLQVQCVEVIKDAK